MTKAPTQTKYSNISKNQGNFREFYSSKSLAILQEGFAQEASNLVGR